MRRDIKNEILQTLYPDDIKCMVCGDEIRPNRYGLCNKCTLDLNDNYCVRCGRHKVGIGDYCGECSKSVMYIDEARSSVVYDDTAKNIVRRLKFGEALYLARPISEYLLDTLIATDWEFDCFTFVPMHKKAKRKRGYNQAELIAENLAERTTTPCLPLLEKIKETSNQARLTRDGRLINVMGAFEHKVRPPFHVVIVDDVMTTGATLNECAKVLKKAGATVVYGLTFASVPTRPFTDKPTVNIRDFKK